jgi:hypothetical protein
MDKFIIKNNRLLLSNMIEHPRVGGSIPALATMFNKGFD